jgi:hypothetical protein
MLFDLDHVFSFVDSFSITYGRIKTCTLFFCLLNTSMEQVGAS